METSSGYSLVDAFSKRHSHCEFLHPPGQAQTLPRVGQVSCEEDGQKFCNRHRKIIIVNQDSSAFTYVTTKIFTFKVVVFLIVATKSLQPASPETMLIHHFRHCSHCLLFRGENNGENTLTFTVMASFHLEHPNVLRLFCLGLARPRGTRLSCFATCRRHDFATRFNL